MGLEHTDTCTHTHTTKNLNIHAIWFLWTFKYPQLETGLMISTWLTECVTFCSWWNALVVVQPFFRTPPLPNSTLNWPSHNQGSHPSFQQHSFTALITQTKGLLLFTVISVGKKCAKLYFRLTDTVCGFMPVVMEIYGEEEALDIDRKMERGQYALLELRQTCHTMYVQ